MGKPDWYLYIADDFKRLEEQVQKELDPEKRKEIKREVYEMVETALRQKSLPLATSGEDLDRERRPIDTIVIHHTKNAPGMTLERLNAVQLLRIYGMYYANPTSAEERDFKGKPVWSGHFYNNEQVFWGYHWLIRENGSTEHILDDKYVGWHAGNWEVNTCSIAISIDDDLTEKEPSEAALKAVAEVIRSNYVQIKPEQIVGHCDVSKQTQCPGHLFHESWQAKLIR